jgi:hypothetical protein
MANYFTPREMACKCCGLIVSNIRFVDILNEIRAELGEPLYVTSWTRCESHNRWVGGVDNSRHITGLAVDIVKPRHVAQFIKLATKKGLQVVPYSGHLHVELDEKTN